MEQLLCMHPAEWRKWLSENHKKLNEIWLVFFKGHNSGQSLTYSDALDEALCFGWIDSLIKRIDDSRYVRKFSRRREISKWSEANKVRFEKLEQEGRIEAAGYASVEIAKKNGSWYRPDRPTISDEIPEKLLKAIEHNPKAKEYFDRLPPSHRRQYVMWIATAKRVETVEKRVKEAIAMLEKGKPLGLR